MIRRFRDDLERSNFLKVLINLQEILFKLIKLFSGHGLNTNQFFLQVCFIIRKLFFSPLLIALFLALNRALLCFVFFAYLLKRHLTSLLIYISNNECTEIHHLLKLLNTKIKHETNLGRNTAQEPNMRHRSRKLNMTHTLTTYGRLRHFYSTLVTNNALVTNFLIFSTVTLPILGRSENFFREKTLLFRLLSTVVNGLRLSNLAI